MSFLCSSFPSYGRTGKPIRAVFMICTFLPATKVAGYFLPVPPGLSCPYICLRVKHKNSKFTIRNPKSKIGNSLLLVPTI